MQFRTIIQNDINKLIIAMPSSVKVDSNGDIYVLDGYHKLIKFNSNGQPLKSWRTYADTRRGGFDNYPEDFAIDKNGNVFLLDTHAGKVIIFDNDGAELQQWDLVKGKGNDRFAKRILLDQDENICILNYRSLIQKYDQTGNCLAQWEITPDARDMALEPNGGFWVLYSKSLSLVDASGQLVQQWPLADYVEYIITSPEGYLYGIGSGSVSKFNDGVPVELFPLDLSTSSFGSPFTIDRNGNFLIAHGMVENAVTALNSSGTIVAKYGKGPFEYQLVQPYGIAFSEQSIFVLDAYQRTIYVFDKTGQFKTSWGPEGKKAYSFIPQGLLFIQDTLYVTDSTSNGILKFTEEGDYKGQLGGPGTDLGQFDNPQAIACDTEGYVYVADTGNKRIQKLNTDGHPILQWTTEGLNITDFHSPSDIAINIENTVYVLDKEGTAVMFTNEGKLIRIAVNTLIVSRPRSIALDTKGNFYIAEYHEIKKFEYEGILWATVGGYGSNESQFNTIGRIAIDTDGKLYAADILNKRVQVIDIKELPEKD